MLTRLWPGFLILLPVAYLVFAGSVSADNGMSPVAYDPKSAAMAGSCLACDHGIAAAMDSPAALGLIREGHRADFAFLFDNPGLSTNAGTGASSVRQQLWVPTLGWSSRRGRLSYGAGVFKQGGLASEYRGIDTVGTQRYEVFAGRLVVPFAWRLNDQWLIGGGIGFAWLGMDLGMTLSDGAALLSGTSWQGTFTGAMTVGIQDMVTTGALQGVNPLNTAYLNFNDPGKVAGAANATGHGGIISMIYEMTPGIRFGFSYQDETAYASLKGEQASLRLDMNMDDNYINGSWNGVDAGGEAGTYSTHAVTLNGRVRVRNFRWPAVYGLGFSSDLPAGLEFHAALRYLPWSRSMDTLRVDFTAEGSSDSTGIPLVTDSVRIDINQKWRDQTVFSIGGAVPAWTGAKLHFGYSYANTPVPNAYLSPIFASLVTEHYTLGAEHAFSDRTQLTLSYVSGVGRKQVNVNDGVWVKQVPMAIALSLVRVY